MEGSDPKRPAPQTEGNAQPPWIREPDKNEAPRVESAPTHDDAPIEEPGYGHGV
jgi:hypothetical protein